MEPAAASDRISELAKEAATLAEQGTVEGFQLANEKFTALRYTPSPAALEALKERLARGTPHLARACALSIGYWLKEAASVDSLQ